MVIDDIDLDEAVQEFEKSQQPFQESQQYYDADKRDIAIGIATPPALRSLLAQIGVPRIYVQSIVDRLIVTGFRLGAQGDSDQELWSWWQANNLDVEAFLGYAEALVLGRFYVTVSAPDDYMPGIEGEDIPIIRVESAKSIYAKIDPRTREVMWAVRVVKDPETAEVISTTLYTPNQTVVLEKENGQEKIAHKVQHNMGIVPVVPFTNRSTVSDINGSSAITPEIRSVVDAMSRLLMNMQTTSELMATPQRVIFGATKDELMEDSDTVLDLYISSYMAVDDPQGKVTQLPAAELRNYTEAMTQLLKLASAYTGLPPQYLSYATDNPASAEAIKSSETRLVRTCENKCAVFGEAWERVMRLAMRVMGRDITLDHYRMETVWRDPSTPTYQAMADASTKLYANGNGPIPKQQVRLDMGYSPEQIRQMEIWDNESPDAQAMNMYLTGRKGKEVVDATAEDGVPRVSEDTRGER